MCNENKSIKLWLLKDTFDCPLIQYQITSNFLTILKSNTISNSGIDNHI